MTNRPAVDYFLLFHFIICIGSVGDGILGEMNIITRAQIKKTVEGSNRDKILISDRKYELVGGLEDYTLKGLLEG